MVFKLVWVWRGEGSRIRVREHIYEKQNSVIIFAPWATKPTPLRWIANEWIEFKASIYKLNSNTILNYQYF